MNSVEYGCILKMYKDDLKSKVFQSTCGNDLRTVFEHDKDRIIFSRAFRRLSSKTQIVTAYGKITSDHLRSRLTHSLEVAQIAKSIAKYVNKEIEDKKLNCPKLNYDLIEAIALGHDLGHTPYGHVGEEALFKFMFAYDGEKREYNKEILKSMDKKEYGMKPRLRHCFQSLKLCCFLEKHYCPDNYGLNLTIATLDGIFKHSNMTHDEMKLYKTIFNCYVEKFYIDSGKCSNNPADKELIDTMENLIFNHISPITYEGIIVAMADELAQLSHDIEDIRRLSNPKQIYEYYGQILNKIEGVFEDESLYELISEYLEDIEKNYDKFRDYSGDFEKFLDNISHTEYNYIKIILNMPVPAIKNLIYKINDYENIENELQNTHFGEFEYILKFLNNTDNTRTIFYKLDKISKIKDKLVMDIPNVVKWDIKGVYLCLELAQKMYDAINYERNINSSKSPKIEEYLKIFSKKYRGHLKKSYEAGKMFYEKIDELAKDIENEKFKELLENYKSNNPADDMGIKFVVWDWMAGMTDSYIIKEYESMTFKRLDLR